MLWGTWPRTNPSPSSTASTIPAVKEEQLSWLISRGTEMFRVIGGSLSTIMSKKVQLNEHGCSKDQRRTLVIILHALLDGIGWFSKYGPPYLGVNGHEGREKLYFSLWGL